MAAMSRRCLHVSRHPRTLWSFMDRGNSAYGYAECYSQPEPPELKQVRLSAIAADPAESQKMISPLQGAFLSGFVRAQRPKSILELGCYVGYSALWLAHGLRDTASSTKPHVWTCERDAAVARTAVENITTAGYKHAISVLNQPAEAVLEAWNRKVDMVFIDANKSAYRQYYDMILDRELLSEHGQIIVDNVLFHGKVHSKPRSRIATKIHEFNQYVANDPRTTQVILPVFDGLMIASRA
ncbi:hypothetical protein H4S01_003537 [Coemansia sp. RSA 2610]|nr:hypothetical protein H4S01_003537 [Coemansia sp. RSA 2610]